jgi:hypothetical protein
VFYAKITNYGRVQKGKPAGSTILMVLYTKIKVSSLPGKRFAFAFCLVSVI